MEKKQQQPPKPLNEGHTKTNLGSVKQEVKIVQTVPPPPPKPKPK